MTRKVEVVLTAVDRTQAAFAKAQEGLKSLAPAASMASAALARFGIGLPITMASIAGGALTAAANTAQLSREVRAFAQLSGTTTEEFTALAYATDRYGIGQEKLADIMKDVQDKVGDFIQNGGGPLKDFFDNIAPKVGVTADQFRALSGPDALQLYFSSLERANLSQSDTVFYMEAIANDATRLIPLLRNGGAEFKALADEARDLGIAMGDDAVDKAIEFGDNLKKLQALTKALQIDIGNSLIPTVNRLAAEFLDARKAGLTFGEMLNAIWRTTPLDAGKQIKELSAQIDALQQRKAQLNESGWAVSVDKTNIAAELESLNRQREYFKARQRDDALASAGDNYGNESRMSRATIPGKKTRDEKGGKGKTPRAETAAASEEARAYAQAMQQIHQAQIAASTSSMNLTATQQRLVDLVNDPAFANWPEEWQLTALEAGAAAAGIERAAEEQQRLNELLGTADLENARADMLLLADAFHAGAISADEFSAAAERRLNNVKGAAENAAGSIDMVITNAFSNAADAVVNFGQEGQRSVGDLIAATIRDLLKLELQMQAMAIYKGGAAGGSGGLLGFLGNAITGAITGGFGDWLGAASGVTYGTNAFSQQSMMLAAQSFDGGGGTGNGPRAGGLDGKGGFWAIMHPQETVYDHAKGQGPTGAAPVVNLTIQAQGNPQMQSQSSRYDGERWIVDMLVADAYAGGPISRAQQEVFPMLRRPGK